MRELLRAEEVLDQLTERALDLIHRSLAAENLASTALNPERNRPTPRFLLGCAQHDTRPERARSIVNLRLRQIEQVFTLNITRTHIVTYGEPSQFAPRIDHQRQFGFRH